MSDERKKISVLVPVSILDNLKESSDLNITEATIKGLELLVNNIKSDENNTKSDDNIIREYQIENAGLKEINGMLKRELEVSRQDKEDFKQIHTNYMLQMQMILNQKVITAPKDCTPDISFSHNEEVKSTGKEYTCLQCNGTFMSKNSNAKYCSEKCRSAWRRKNK